MSMDEFIVAAALARKNLPHIREVARPLHMILDGPTLENDSFEGCAVPCAICWEAFEATAWSIRNELPCERICQWCEDADDDYYRACAEGEEEEEDA